MPRKGRIQNSAKQKAPTLQPKPQSKTIAKIEAVDKYNKLLKRWGSSGKGFRKGWLGESSSSFVTHPKWAIKLLSGNVSAEGVAPQLKDLKQMGTVGAVAASAYGLLVKPYVWQRRRLIKQTMRLFTETGEEENYRKLAMRTTRLLYENHTNINTTLHDRKLEGEIFDIFGELAKKSNSFSKRHVHIAKWPQRVVGKMFLRDIVRNSLLMNYQLLLKIRNNPEKFDAIKHTLIGESVQGPIEEHDARRLNFAASILQEEVPRIDQYIQQKGLRGDVIRQILSIRSKGKKYLDNHQEEERFYHRVLATHAIEPTEVDAYAFQAYFAAKEVFARTRKPSKDISTLHQLVTDIEAIYPKEILENNREWLKKRKQKDNGLQTTSTADALAFMEGSQVTFKPGKKGMTFKPSRR